MVDTLDGYCQGLFEVRVALDRQYRMLGAHMGSTPILLHGFIKPDEKVPREECDRAFRHLADVNSNPEKHRLGHTYDD
jgi:phage-related protein